MAPRKNSWVLRVLFLALAILLCIGTAQVSARYATPEGANAGINANDMVFLTEENLNFTVFKNANPVLNPFNMAYRDGSSPAAIQLLDANAVLISAISVSDSKYLNGAFYPYYNDSSWGTSSIVIAQGTTGNMRVRPVNTDAAVPANDPQLPVIPYDMNVQFYLKSSNLNSGNFVHGWHEYKLQFPDGQVRSQVTNAAGDAISLKGLVANPGASNDTLAFNISGQLPSATDSQLAGTFYMTFQTESSGTNGLDLSLPYSFSVKRFLLSANISPTNTERDKTVTLTIYGKPYMYYTIVINDTMDGKPEFPASGTYDIYTSKYNVTVHPNVYGNVTVPLYIPELEGDNGMTTRIYYPVVYQTRYPSTSVTTAIAVGGVSTRKITLKEPGSCSNDPLFYIGDRLQIKGSVGWTPGEGELIYLFMTGPNLPSNGAKPSDPTVAVVDGDNSTFDAVELTTGATNFTYYWYTSKTGLSSGTYTIYATRDLVGYANRPVINTKAEDYEAISLNDPVINAKFPDEAPGFFAQGDQIVTLTSALGSPNMTGRYYGNIRYYILGLNYRYTGFLESFPLLKTNSENLTIEELKNLDDGCAEFPGYSGINLQRAYSSDLDAGTYTLIYQHPMQNGVFDIFPEEAEQNSSYTGTFSALKASNGNRVDISTYQSSQALNAMQELLTDPNADDTILSDSFTIEEPVVNIDPILDYAVGDAIPVTGTTNLQQKVNYPYNQINNPADSFTLGLYDAQMYYEGKTQSSYRIYNTKGTLRNLKPGAKLRTLLFTIPAEVTKTMKPGEFVAVIYNDDLRIIKEVPFVLHEYGYTGQNSTVSAVSTGSEFTGTSSVTQTRQATTPARTRTTTANVTPDATKKSPGFDAMSLLPVAGILAALAARGRSS